MSRIGKQPVEIPKGVTATLSGAKLAVKGPKGQLEMQIHPMIKMQQDGQTLVCSRPNDSCEARSLHGLVRALAANLVTGVSKGFERKLEINGVGYRAEAKGKQIVFQLGYSHPIEFDLPAGITAKVEKNIISLAGADKQLLGATAANIRGLRPPEPYKGKGIRYRGEQLLRKVGQAAG